MTPQTPAGTLTAALIIIGNEILSGRTQDTNTAWIGEHLIQMGVMLTEVRMVQDVESEIIAAVDALRVNVDYLFTTGGIGPTHDDITAESVAKAFGRTMVLSEEAMDMMAAHYGNRDEITPARQKMAMVPEGAGLIPNPVSGAPGFVVENVYVMAGVPRIMQAMFDNVMAMLKPGKPLLSHTIACSLQESMVAVPLEEIQRRYPDINIGSYPNYRGGLLGLSIVMRSTEAEALKAAFQDVLDMIHEAGGHPHAMSVISDD